MLQTIKYQHIFRRKIHFYVNKITRFHTLPPLPCSKHNHGTYSQNYTSTHMKSISRNRRNSISFSAKVALFTALGVNLGVVFGSAIPAIIGKGAPFVPTLQKTLDIVFDIALPKHLISESNVNSNDIIVVDLGSGDGRVAIAAAKYGYAAIGYEINPILVLYSKLKWYYHLFTNRINAKEIGRASFHCKNIWSIKTLKDANVIFVYGLYPIMKELSAKIWNEGNDDVIVISYVFEMDSITWIKVFDMDGVRLYKKRI